MAVKIGLVGTGTVGGGCIDIMLKHKESFERHFGIDVELVRVCSLDSAGGRSARRGSSVHERFQRHHQRP